MLTGQGFFRLEEAAKLWVNVPDKFRVYTEILEESGYHIDHEAKGWGPGD